MDEKPRQAEDETPGSEVADSRLARREALKKAAAAGAVGGALWAGPRVEGLSLLPDYASAGTATVAAKTFTIDAGGSDGPGSVNSDNSYVSGCDGGTPPIYGNDWASVSSPSNPGVTVTPPNVNARNTVINMDYVVPAPSGNAANVDAVIPSGWDADLNNNQNVVVTFNYDPPWNKCRINAVAMNRCDGSTGTVNIGPGNPAAGVINGPGPGTFAVTVTVPGPQPSNMAQLRITVGCS